MLPCAKEYQVVLLAGGSGTRMYPLAEEVSKHLLPIANRPMISYQLEVLEKIGFKEVIVVINEKNSVIEEILDSYGPRLDIKVIKQNQKLGTADALIQASSSIDRDFIVMSGDLIIDSNAIASLIDVHRTKDSAVSLLLKKKQEMKDYLDYLGLEDTSDGLKRLVYYSPAGLNDTKSGSSLISIPRLTLVNHPRITVHNKLLDAHLYIFSHWVLDILPDLSDPKSIKCSLIPKLVEIQNQSLRDGGESAPESALQNTQKKAIELSLKRTESSRLSCYAIIIDDSYYCARANTSKEFLDINKHVAFGKTPFLPFEPKGPNAYLSKKAHIHSKASVGKLSIVGDDTSIGQGTNIKGSLIGKRCKIGDDVAIVDSIIFDDVTIENGVTIKQNSIICSNVEVKEQAKIIGSTVRKGSTVIASAYFHNEIFG